MSQGKFIEVLRGQHEEGSDDPDGQGSARLDQITEIVAGLRVGAESAPQIQGLASFKASVEDFGEQTRKIEERPDWADSARESIGHMMDDMFSSVQKEELPEFLSIQDTGFQKRQNRALIFAASLTGVMILGAAGYGFYYLGLKDATISRSRDMAVITASESGRIALDNAAVDNRQNPNKDQSRLQKEDLAKPVVITPVTRETSLVSRSDRLSQDDAENAPVKIPEIKTDGKADAEPELKPDAVPAKPVQPVEIEPKPGKKTAAVLIPRPTISAAPLKSATLVKEVETSTEPALPKERFSNAGKPLTADKDTTSQAKSLPAGIAVPAKTPPVKKEIKLAAKTSMAADETASPGPTISSGQTVKTDASEPLDGLLGSVVESIQELGKPPGTAAAGQDPAKKLRIRMTKLATAATAQGKSMNDVKQLLETKLMGLAPETVPDVLKNAAGKVDISPLVFAITQPKKSQP